MYVAVEIQTDVSGALCYEIRVSVNSQVATRIQTKPDTSS